MSATRKAAPSRSVAVIGGGWAGCAAAVALADAGHAVTLQFGPPGPPAVGPTGDAPAAPAAPGETGARPAPAYPVFGADLPARLTDVATPLAQDANAPAKAPNPNRAPAPASPSYLDDWRLP